MPTSTGMASTPPADKGMVHIQSGDSGNNVSAGTHTSETAIGVRTSLEASPGSHEAVAPLLPTRSATATVTDVVAEESALEPGGLEGLSGSLLLKLGTSERGADCGDTVSRSPSPDIEGTAFGGPAESVCIRIKSSPHVRILSRRRTSVYLHAHTQLASSLHADIATCPCFPHSLR